MEKKFSISVSITIKEDDVRKNYSIDETYTGDPTKLDVTVYINKWFIDNKVDMNTLDSFYASVCLINENELLGGLDYAY